MNSEFYIAIFAGLGGMLGWGLADFFAKKTIDEIGDIVSLVWAHIFGTAAFVVVALVAVLSKHTLRFPNSLDTWLLLILFGIGQAVVYLLVYRGFAKGQLAVLNPIFASFSGLAAILAVIFFGEILTGNLAFVLFVIFVGVLLLNMDVAAMKSKRFGFVRVNGFTEVASATIIAAFWTIAWNEFIHDNDWIVFALFMYLFMTITMLAVSWFQKTKLTFNKPHAWKFLLFIGVCETVAYLAISLGYSKTSQISVIALLSGAFSLPTIFLARVFLKEKTTKIQTIGSLIIILGIILLPLL